MANESGSVIFLTQTEATSGVRRNCFREGGFTKYFENFADVFLDRIISFSELTENTIWTLFCQIFSAPQANLEKKEEI